MKLYAEKFKKIRQLKRISVQEIARKANVSRYSIWAWENGKRTPSEAIIRELAKAVNTGITEISDLKPIKETLIKDFSTSMQSFLEIADLDIKNRNQIMSQLQGQVAVLENKLSNASTIINALISSLDTAFYIKSTEQKFIVANNAFFKMLKLNVKTDIIGKEDKDIFSIKDAKYNNEQDTEVVRTGKPIISYENYIPGTRKRLSGLISKIPIFDRGKKIIGIIGVFVDMTERIILKKNLEHSENNLSSFMNSATEGFILCDSKLNYILLNDTALMVFPSGTRRKDIIGKNILEIIPGLKSNGRYKKYRKVINTGKPLLLDDITLGSKFGNIQLALRAFKVNDGIGFTFTDITEQKTNEKRLIESETKYRKIADNLPAVLYQFMINSDGTFIFPYVSSKAKDLLGISAESIMQDSSKLFSRVQPEDLKNLQESIMKSAESFETFPVAFRYIKGKEVIWLEACGTPRKLENGLSLWDGFIFDITKRKKAEASLTRLATIVKDSNDAVTIQDLNGNITAWNRGAEDIYGWTETEALSMNINDIVPEGYRKEALELIADVKKGKKVKSFETKRKSKDGRELAVWLTVTKLENTKGDLTSITTTERDITEQKINENQLLEKQQQLENEKEILMAVMSGTRNAHLVYLDTDFNFVRVNEKYAQTCGFTPEEMIGKNHFALYPDTENEAIFARVRDTGVPIEFRDKPFSFPDQPKRGVTYWDWTLIPIKDQDEVISGLVFSLFETTKRVLAINEIKKNEEMLRSIYNSDIFGMFLWDKDGKLTDCNETFSKLLGYSRSEFQSEKIRWSDLTPSEYSELDKKAMKELTLTGKMTPFEKEYIHKNGKRIPVRLYATTLPDQNLNGACYVVDITETKTAEAKLWEKSFMLNSASSIIAESDLEGKLIFVNSAFLNAWGFNNPDEVLGHPFIEFWDVKEQLKEIMDRLIGTGHGKWSGQARAKKKDGSFFDLYVSAATVYNSKGGPIALMSTSFEITRLETAQ
jgi:PAS domain S-box-containing protein